MGGSGRPPRPPRLRADVKSALRRVTPLAVLVVAALVSAASASEPPRPLRVVTFNLFHGGASSGLVGDGDALEERLALAITELRALAPDVIAVQEASIGWGRGNVASRLADALGM